MGKKAWVLVMIFIAITGGGAAAGAGHSNRPPTLCVSGYEA